MKNRSFTLIETVMAIFILTVGTVGAFSLIQKTISFSSITSSRLVAAYLAQEGIEIVRNIRDTNYLQKIPWDTGLSACAAGCEADYNDSALSSYSDRFLKIDSAFYTYDSGADTLYKRKITIVPQANVLEVKVEVDWTERGRSHQVTAQTELYDWR
jgi:Tfp pilus assembly protein PilV